VTKRDEFHKNMCLIVQLFQVAGEEVLPVRKNTVLVRDGKVNLRQELWQVCEYLLPCF
jgi:hypothetical protein